MELPCIVITCPTFTCPSRGCKWLVAEPHHLTSPMSVSIRTFGCKKPFLQSLSLFGLYLPAWLPLQHPEAWCTQVLALCGVCLFCTTALSWAAPGPAPGKSGAELDKAIEANVEAQDYAEETAPVRAQIIKGEPAALISSGTGDISTTGGLVQHHLPLLASDKNRAVGNAHGW